MSETARNPFAPTTVAVYCLDGPESLPKRKAAAQAHLRWIESMLEHIAVAGPLYSGDGSRMTGSLYVFKTTSLEQARAWLESDPYFAQQFWSSIEYRPFLPAAGGLVGGTVW